MNNPKSSIKVHVDVTNMLDWSENPQSNKDGAKCMVKLYSWKSEKIMQ